MLYLTCSSLSSISCTRCGAFDRVCSPKVFFSSSADALGPGSLPADRDRKRISLLGADMGAEMRVELRGELRRLMLLPIACVATVLNATRWFAAKTLPVAAVFLAFKSGLLDIDAVGLSSGSGPGSVRRGVPGDCSTWVGSGFFSLNPCRCSSV